MASNAGIARSPLLWLGAGVVMIVAIVVGIFADDESFGGFSESEVRALSESRN